MTKQTYCTCCGKRRKITEIHGARLCRECAARLGAIYRELQAKTALEVVYWMITRPDMVADLMAIVEKEMRTLEGKN